MSRVACGFGFLLGAVSLVTGGQAGLEPAGWLLIGFGLLVGVTAWLGLRRSSVAQGLMSFLGLLALARSLPIYFQTLEFWPTVPFVLAGSLTLGLGVVGLVMDHFPGPAPPDDQGL